MTEITPELVRGSLELLLASDALAKSAANRRLLKYLVQRSLQAPDGPKEVEIAIDVFGRSAAFNGSEDSVVRVAAHALRQKLAEHYAGAGRNDTLIFDIPKGGYRVTFTPRPVAVPAIAEVAAPVAPLPGSIAPAPKQGWRLFASIALPLLAISLAANAYLWKRDAGASDPAQDRVRESLLWRGMVEDRQPLMVVLGDLFMFTQVDPQTGRLQSVRDTQINSSDDLRAFLASNPSLAAERGLRYSTLVQKSAVLGLAAVLPVIAQPGRQVEVRLRDELLPEDIHKYDVIYIGPLARLGPLASHFHVRSRYRFDAVTATVTDTGTGTVYQPEGDLGDHHKDYALVARFPGPNRNRIMLFTAGGRNAGLQQVMRMLTSAQGLEQFERSVEDLGTALPESFEALIAVSGYKQTDLAADLVEIHALDEAAPR